jgi:hypothetical protein
MLVTRDQAELRDTPYITFTVYRPSEDKPTVCGFHMFYSQEAGREVLRGSTALDLPVKQAFENACRFATERGISAIWISDQYSLLKMEQIEQMEQPR